MMEQDLRQMKPQIYRLHPLNRHLGRPRIAGGVSKQQDQTLLLTCVAGVHRCVNSRYAKFKYTGMKSDYIQITQWTITYIR